MEFFHKGKQKTQAILSSFLGAFITSRNINYFKSFESKLKWLPAPNWSATPLFHSFVFPFLKKKLESLNWWNDFRARYHNRAHKWIACCVVHKCCLITILYAATTTTKHVNNTFFLLNFLNEKNCCVFASICFKSEQINVHFY